MYKLMNEKFKFYAMPWCLPSESIIFHDLFEDNFNYIQLLWIIVVIYRVAYVSI